MFDTFEDKIDHLADGGGNLNIIDWCVLQFEDFYQQLFPDEKITDEMRNAPNISTST